MCAPCVDTSDSEAAGDEDNAGDAGGYSYGPLPPSAAVRLHHNVAAYALVQAYHVAGASVSALLGAAHWRPLVC